MTHQEAVDKLVYKYGLCESVREELMSPPFAISPEHLEALGKKMEQLKKSDPGESQVWVKVRDLDLLLKVTYFLSAIHPAVEDIHNAYTPVVEKLLREEVRQYVEMAKG